MPVVTAIQLQRNKQVANIFVDGNFICGLSLITLAKQQLKVGKEITDSNLDTFLKQSVYEKFLNNSYRFLSYRPRAEKEIRTYLINKSKRENPEFRYGKTIERVIQKLKEQKMVNDEEFAQWWLNQRQTFHPKGKYLLVRELRAKGIDKEIIDNLLEKSNDLSAAKKLVSLKLRSLNLDSPAGKKKLIGFLSRRGFSWETIKRVVDEATTKK